VPCPSPRLDTSTSLEHRSHAIVNLNGWLVICISPHATAGTLSRSALDNGRVLTRTVLDPNGASTSLGVVWVIRKFPWMRSDPVQLVHFLDDLLGVGYELWTTRFVGASVQPAPLLKFDHESCLLALQDKMRLDAPEKFNHVLSV
jgi:hypothetical protein